MTDKRMLGIGNAPTRATTLPTHSQGRKECPVSSGVLDYFPDAIAAIAKVSYKANEQHNSGQPLHWARSKSTDEADALMRHFLQRGLLDEDGLPHSAKMAWRALALLQKEVETAVEIKDGPYCCNCDRLAEFRSLIFGYEGWCSQCIDEKGYEWSNFVVMETI